jgi:hypothetical protein
MQSLESFKVGELIWAKLKGYPWWPGVIVKIIDKNDYS